MLQLRSRGLCGRWLSYRLQQRHPAAYVCQTLKKTRTFVPWKGESLILVLHGNDGLSAFSGVLVQKRIEMINIDKHMKTIMKTYEKPQVSACWVRCCWCCGNLPASQPTHNPHAFSTQRRGQLTAAFGADGSGPGACRCFLGSSAGNSWKFRAIS